MATRTVNLRLPEEMIEYLTRNNDSINQAVIAEISAIKRIRTVAMGELKGLFTVPEWMFLADAFNGTLIDDVFCANVGAFIAGCEDAEKYEGTASKWGVDLPSFIAKVKTLHGANIEAIYTRIKDYWEHCSELDINNWSNF